MNISPLEILERRWHEIISQCPEPWEKHRLSASASYLKQLIDEFEARGGQVTRRNREFVFDSFPHALVVKLDTSLPNDSFMISVK